MPPNPLKALRTRSSVRSLAAFTALAALASACSGSSHGGATTSSKTANSIATPTPSGPCDIGAQVTCVQGTQPIWTLAQLSSRLLTTKDVLPTMTHPMSSTWWGETLHNPYIKKWVPRNYVPGCYYDWLHMSGPERSVSGHYALWSQFDREAPDVPKIALTQYAYVYTNVATLEHDAGLVWNQSCAKKSVPAKHFAGGYYVPTLQFTDEVKRGTVSGWAHLRIISHVTPIYTQDVVDILQAGNILLVSVEFERYQNKPTAKELSDSLEDADTMFTRQLDKLTALS